MPDRDYLFVDLTTSICGICLRKIEAKIIEQSGHIVMRKWCPEHKFQEVLISTDPAFYRLQRSFIKPGQIPLRFNSPIQYGCPYDCGLCPDHEQHSCLTLVEITDHCNLECPVCYANSGPSRLSHRSLAEIEAMLDAVVQNEGRPDIVQISGGEPTIHPDFFAVLAAARRRPIRHLMVNTNGLRIAREDDFVKRLATFVPGFEVYLQFDSLDSQSLRTLRGADLLKSRMLAIEALNRYDISTTLVVTLAKGINDGQIGDIIKFASQQPCVRGVTFQPVQIAGRTLIDSPHQSRLTVSEVRSGIADQSGIFKAADVIPVPCHPECVLMAYGLKSGGTIIPVTRLVDPQIILSGEGSTISFERDAGLIRAIYKAFAANHSPASATAALGQLLCCLPQVTIAEELSYRNVFRIIVMQFLDAWNFDIRSVKRSCVHMAQPDGHLIPFDTYNLFYRDERRKILEQVRNATGYDLRVGGRPIGGGRA